MTFFPKETDFIDIHSHQTELGEGVFRIHNVFTSGFSNIRTDAPVSIGLHPWHISNDSIIELADVIKKAASLDNLMAVGEAGLDRMINTPVEQQMSVFRTQIELSIELNKPLIIHCVRAFPELFGLRKEYTKATSWIVHGFSASPAIAAECVKKGIYISLSQRLFRNPDKALKVARAVPISMVFAETDEDPLPVTEIYNIIAGYYGLSLSAVKGVLFDNFQRVFC